MPTFKGQLRDREIDVLIDMMKNLKDFDAKGNYIGGSPPQRSDADRATEDQRLRQKRATP